MIVFKNQLAKLLEKSERETLLPVAGLPVSSFQALIADG